MSEVREIPQIRLEPCKLPRYPVWEIYRVVSDTPLLPSQAKTITIEDREWFIVEPGLGPGLYVVPARKQQLEIEISLKVEMGR